ncbi:MAG: Ni/Fe hydrogenase subunit alpha [Chloroflexi bacterium]|nr:Ni/Fe hydrogenase subunit alpha [Chloroflexota bacterium]
MPQRRIKVDYLARVEGEGALDIRLSDGKVAELKLKIWEPPRLFEAFLTGRSYLELPDMVSRICGICPVAYQMSATHATERAFGVTVGGAIRKLRRLFYIGEWIESHLLHIYMLAAPDFLGYGSVIPMAKDYPEAVKRGLRLKRLGNDIVVLLAGREINPVSARAGGFYRVPARDDLLPLLDRLQEAKDDAARTVEWVASFDIPDLSRDIEFVSLRHPDEYPMSEGRLVSSKGLDVVPEDFESHFAEEQVPYSTALRSTIRGRGAYFVGPLARVNLNLDKLSPDAQAAARRAGIQFPNANPFTSIIARALEVLHAVDEAMEIIQSYAQPAAPFVETRPRAARGAAITEAPRGILYHRYDFDADGLIRKAVIIPPTAQNQRQIEEDLLEYVPRVIDLPIDQATLKCEMAIRNYDPCISCSTHFLKLNIQYS